MLRSLLAYSTVAAVFVAAQYYNAGQMSGLGCVVTKSKLFSHGNYIRDLSGEELAQVAKYKEDLADFQKRIGEAFAHADALSDPNATLPAIPPRPVAPAFCTSNETTLYILGSCTVQNHKIYVNGKFARELDDEEKSKLVEFGRRLAAQNLAAAAAAAAAVSSEDNANGTTASTTTAMPPQEPLTLDFCTEF